MKVSLKWLQEYFAEPLPAAADVADALTFHAAEIEEAEGDLMDVKVLPDRAAYMLSHRGIARELAAALDRTLARDPLRDPVPEFPGTDAIGLSIEDAHACPRYMGALVQGVTVGPSPEWLRAALESVGQRSINNIVDATNYVMLDIGQPLHAFDAKLLKDDGGKYAIGVRSAREGERITTLTGDEYALPEGTLLITDAHADLPIGIAGVKGGKTAQVTETTTDILIESANFDGSAVRKTAQALKLFTDASTRFQNRPSPSLAGYAMRDILALICGIAGGEVIGVRDAYPAIPEAQPVTVSLGKINGILGSSFTQEEVKSVFERLGFSFTEQEDAFIVLPPFERRDIAIPEDLAEEVGRILGYDRIPSTELLGIPTQPDQAKFRGLERVRDFLVERGFIEISSPAFAGAGDIELANPLQQDRPWLRATLLANIKDALARAVTVAPGVLGPVQMVKVFEVGTIFPASGEAMAVALGVEAIAGKGAEDSLKENVATIEQELLQSPGKARFSLDARTVEFVLTDEDLVRLGTDYAPAPAALGPYTPFSIYPFALRDIAVWTPSATTEDAVERIVREAAGPLLMRMDCFDRFEKEGRVSYAFRLVFESADKTLSDAELNPLMERVTSALNAEEGFAVR